VSAAKAADSLRRQVSTLAKFGGRALRIDNIGDLLQEATRLVSEGINVDLVKVLQLLPDGQNLLVRAGVNWHPGVVGHATIPAHGGSAAGHALRTNEPVISEDVSAETRFNIPKLLIDHDVKSTVNVVIRGDDGPFGVLEVDSRRHRKFEQDDIAFLQNYANLLAAAIHRADTQRDLADATLTQKVLLHELQHRINNMLMTIRAVAQRTRAGSANLDDFAKAFDDRLASIARTHNLLERPGTSGVKIRDLLMQELSALGGVEGENMTARGPDIIVSAGQAQVLSVVFHELATNAVKHGALSKRDGRIGVSWENKTAEGQMKVSVHWRESGVSIVSEPIRRGYGSEILEGLYHVCWEGGLNASFIRMGLNAVLVLPPNLSSL
jgi:two-component sensor histidine kinase